MDGRRLYARRMLEVYKAGIAGGGHDFLGVSSSST